jgi:centromere protein C
VDSEDEGETEEERDLGGDSNDEASDDGGTSEAGGANASGVVEDDAEDEESAAVVSEYDDDASRGRDHAGGEDDVSGRRSRRTRYPPLAYWKNERFVYERPKSGVGEVLPVVAGVSERSKTPVAKPPRPQGGKGRKRSAEAAPLDPNQLPRGLVVKKSDKGRVWHDQAQAPRKLRVVCRASSMAGDERALPSASSDVGGVAAQAFFTPPMSVAMPGWISGYVRLPPSAVKDPETVGNCSQLFFVAECQGAALEVAVALPSATKDKRGARFDSATAQRYLLSAGDQFFMPPHNVYRLENHSALQDAKLFWVIIKVSHKTEREAQRRARLPKE